MWGPSTDTVWDTRETLEVVMESMLWSDGERLRGYLDALDEAGIPVDLGLISDCIRTEEGTIEAVSRMLAMDAPPTALLATETDAMVGALRVIRQRGLHYPDDISLIGFDDSSWAGVMDPPLTMIAQPMVELGRQAAQRVFALIDGDEGIPVVNTVPARLVVRGSVSEPGTPVSLSGAGAR